MLRNLNVEIRVNEYTLTSYEGAGAFASVWRAKKGNSDPDWVLKFFWTGTDRALEAFLRGEAGGNEAYDADLRRPERAQQEAQFDTERNMLELIRQQYPPDDHEGDDTHPSNWVPGIPDDPASREGRFSPPESGGREIRYVVNRFVPLTTIQNLTDGGTLLDEPAALEITRRHLILVDVLHAKNRYLADTKYENYWVDPNSLQGGTVISKMMDWNGSLSYQDKLVEYPVHYDMWKALAFLFTMMTGIEIHKRNVSYTAAQLAAMAGPLWQAKMSLNTRFWMSRILSAPPGSLDVSQLQKETPFTSERLAELLLLTDVSLSRVPADTRGAPDTGDLFQSLRSGSYSIAARKASQLKLYDIAADDLELQMLHVRMLAHGIQLALDNRADMDAPDDTKALMAYIENPQGNPPQVRTKHLRPLATRLSIEQEIRELWTAPLADNTTLQSLYYKGVDGTLDAYLGEVNQSNPQSNLLGIALKQLRDINEALLDIEPQLQDIIGKQGLNASDFDTDNYAAHVVYELLIAPAVASGDSNTDVLALLAGNTPLDAAVNEWQQFKSLLEAEQTNITTNMRLLTTYRQLVKGVGQRKLDDIIRTTIQQQDKFTDAEYDAVHEQFAVEIAQTFSNLGEAHRYMAAVFPRLTLSHMAYDAIKKKPTTGAAFVTKLLYAKSLEEVQDHIAPMVARHPKELTPIDESCKAAIDQRDDLMAYGNALATLHSNLERVGLQSFFVERELSLIGAQVRREVEVMRQELKQQQDQQQQLQQQLQATAEHVEQLEGIANQTTDDIQGIKAAQQQNRGTRNLWLLAGAAVLVAVIALGIGAFAAFGPSDDDGDSDATIAALQTDIAVLAQNVTALPPSGGVATTDPASNPQPNDDPNANTDPSGQAPMDGTSGTAATQGTVSGQEPTATNTLPSTATQADVTNPTTAPVDAENGTTDDTITDSTATVAPPNTIAPTNTVGPTAPPVAVAFADAPEGTAASTFTVDDLAIGTEQRIPFTLDNTPSASTIESLVITSSDEAIATGRREANDIVVRGVAEGRARITISLGADELATINVTVTAANTPPSLVFAFNELTPDSGCMEDAGNMVCTLTTATTTLDLPLLGLDDRDIVNSVLAIEIDAPQQNISVVGEADANGRYPYAATLQLTITGSGDATVTIIAIDADEERSAPITATINVGSQPPTLSIFNQEDAPLTATEVVPPTDIYVGQTLTFRYEVSDPDDQAPVLALVPPSQLEASDMGNGTFTVRGVAPADDITLTLIAGDESMGETSVALPFNVLANEAPGVSLLDANNSPLPSTSDANGNNVELVLNVGDTAAYSLSIADPEQHTVTASFAEPNPDDPAVYSNDVVTATLTNTTLAITETRFGETTITLVFTDAFNASTTVNINLTVEEQPLEFVGGNLTELTAALEYTPLPLELITGQNRLDLYTRPVPNATNGIITIESDAEISIIGRALSSDAGEPLIWYYVRIDETNDVGVTTSNHGWIRLSAGGTTQPTTSRVDTINDIRLRGLPIGASVAANATYHNLDGTIDQTRINTPEQDVLVIARVKALGADGKWWYIVQTNIEDDYTLDNVRLVSVSETTLTFSPPIAENIAGYVPVLVRLTPDTPARQIPDEASDPFIVTNPAARIVFKIGNNLWYQAIVELPPAESSEDDSETPTSEAGYNVVWLSAGNIQGITEMSADIAAPAVVGGGVIPDNGNIREQTTTTTDSVTVVSQNQVLMLYFAADGQEAITGGGTTWYLTDVNFQIGWAYNSLVGERSADETVLSNVPTLTEPTYEFYMLFPTAYRPGSGGPESAATAEPNAGGADPSPAPEATETPGS